MQNLNENTLRRFLLLTLTAFAGAALFYCLFRYLLPWCLPFLLAFLIASLLEPLVLHLQRRLRFQRSFSALILTLTLLFLLGGLLSLLWSTLLAQMSALLSAAPAFFDAIPAAANDLLSRLERFSAASPEWFSRFLHEQFLQVITDADSLLARCLSGRSVRSPQRQRRCPAACLQSQPAYWRSFSPPLRIPSFARHLSAAYRRSPCKNSFACATA